MRKISTALTASAAALLLAVPASASAASAHLRPPSASVDLCLGANASACIATNGTGRQVDVSTDSGRHEFFTMTAASVCGGLVNDDCPFDGGAGMNVQMSGDFIETFANGGNCLYASDVSSGQAVMDPCETGDPYQEWVVTAPLSNGNSYIVNVGYSDAEFEINHIDKKPYGLSTHCSGSGCTVWLDPVLLGGNDVEWFFN